MNVKELIEILEVVDPELKVMGSYDGGCGSAPVESAGVDKYRRNAAGKWREVFWIDIDS